MNRAASPRSPSVVKAIGPASLPTPPRSASVKASLLPSLGSHAGSIRVMIADDHAVLREGLRSLLSGQRDFTVVGEASSGPDALRMLDDVRPDVLLLDYYMPGMTGLQVLQEVRARMTSVKAILLTAGVERTDALTLLQSGARGIVLKDAPGELLFKSIRRVHAGEIWIGRDLIGDVVNAFAQSLTPPAPKPAPDFGLTEREFDILRLVVNGDTNKAIAHQLSVREDTVKHHLTSIFNKTGASTRLELAVFTLHHHLLG